MALRATGGKGRTSLLRELPSPYHRSISTAGSTFGPMSPSVPQVNSKRRIRRSQRIGLSVPVLVYGKDMCGEPFRELTRTLSVNANGALIVLAATVEEGQTILVENRNARTQDCRVVRVDLSPNDKWTVGIEFTHVAVGFWQIYFPSVNSRRESDEND